MLVTVGIEYGYKSAVIPAKHVINELANKHLISWKLLFPDHYHLPSFLTQSLTNSTFSSSKKAIFLPPQLSMSTASAQAQSFGQTEINWDK